MTKLCEWQYNLITNSAAIKWGHFEVLHTRMNCTYAE